MNNKELLKYSVIGLIVGLGGIYLIGKYRTEKAIRFIASKGGDEAMMRRNLEADAFFKHFLLARAKAYKTGSKTFKVNHPNYAGETYLTSNSSQKT